MPIPPSLAVAVVEPRPPAMQNISTQFDDDVDMEWEELGGEIGVQTKVGVGGVSALEEKKDDEELGEDLTPIREPNPQNDATRGMGPEAHQKSTLVIPREHVSNPLPNTLNPIDIAGKHIIGEPSEMTTKVESCLDGRRTLQYNDENVPVSDWWRMNASNTRTSIGVVAPSMHGGIKYFAEETNHVARQGPDMPLRFIGSNASLTRPRELWPGTELDGPNKKHRVICDFYAKGWCIKGKSCRFLHIKKEATNALEQRSQYVSVEGNQSLLWNSASTTNIAPKESGVNLNSRAQEFILPVGKDRSLMYGNGPFQQNVSSFSATSCESYRNTGVSSYGRGNSSDTQNTSAYITKSSSDNWEPSVPFRASHFITQKLLSQENIYDPILDSTEPTNVKEGVSKVSFVGEGASAKSSFVGEGASAKSSFVGEGASNKSAPLPSTDELHSTGDNVSKGKSSSNCDPGKQGEPKPRTELEVYRVLHDDKIDLDIKADVYMLQESKAMRHLQAVLIDYVKELVKPTWLNGLLTKDAHKLIVKKAVDKVLSTFQTEPVPCTDENIKLYLSVNHPKLEKLVEGYIEKYGKI